MPFERDPNTLARKWVKPGTEGMEHRIGGLEKDSLTGNISYDPDNHANMTNLRKQKIQNIQNEFQDITITGPENGDVLVIGWGSTNGPISEAQNTLSKNGMQLDHIQLSFLWPLAESLKNIIAKYNSVVVVEMNDGQLFNLLRVEIAPNAKSITQVSGKPFRVIDLIEKFSTLNK
jgi:2-oxoglutarate ferredoxin oxidoreductase subunit alpha